MGEGDGGAHNSRVTSNAGPTYGPRFTKGKPMVEYIRSNIVTSWQTKFKGVEKEI